jgi:hypothetical protein
MKDVAVAVGCRSSSARVGPTHAEFHKAWFDTDCRVALRAVHDAAASHHPNSVDLQAKQRHFRRMCK